MTAARTLRGSLLGLALVAGGCSTLGNVGEFADPISTAGAGPFRFVDKYETAIDGEPANAIVMVSGDAMSSGVAAGDFLFFAAADANLVAPDRDPTLADHEVDFARFEPRTIRRASSNGWAGYIEPEEVFVAEEAWEGDAVFDPWPVLLPDGTLRLYYAAEGGIGLAEASSVDGTLERVGDGHVLGELTDDDLVPSSPTVVVDDVLGTLMYFELGGDIAVARSDDGVDFELVDGDPSTAAWDPLDLPAAPPMADDDPVELRIGHPGAVIAAMGSGRRTVRLYFEVFLSDETRTIGFAASLDGVDFERSARTIVAGESSGTPAPIVDAEGNTRLFVTQSSERANEQRRALYLAVGTSTELPSLPEPEPEPEG